MKTFFLLMFVTVAPLASTPSLTTAVRTQTSAMLQSATASDGPVKGRLQGEDKPLYYGYLVPQSPR
jgi:hypothetical protein